MAFDKALTIDKYRSHDVDTGSTRVRRLLDYLKRTDVQQYRTLVQDLGLRY